MRENLSDRDYKILEILASDGHVTQRSLARLSGVSHGLANIVVRRLIRIGWVKARQVDGRRLRYFLTPQGLNHVMKRSAEYVQKTVSSYRDLKLKMEGMVDGFLRQGKTEFVVVGDGDIPRILQDVLRSKAGVEAEMIPRPNGRSNTGRKNAVVLDCRWQGDDAGVSVLHALLFPPAGTPARSGKGS